MPSGCRSAATVNPARTAPEIKPSDLKKPEEFRLIGRDVMRIELPTKVNGSARYAISRRGVFGLFGGAAAASCASSPLATYAQQAPLPVIGFLHLTSRDETRGYLPE